MQSSWSALGGSKFAKFPERTRWVTIAKVLERTRMLATCKVPGAHAVARNLQSSRSALGGLKFAQFLERTRWLEFLQIFWSARNGSQFAKFLERTRRLAICKVPARWFGFCKVPGAHAGALNLLNPRAHAGARILQSEIPSPSEVPSTSPFPHSLTHPPIHATTCIQSLWRACGRMAAPDGINKRHSPLARPYSTRKPRCGQTPETLSTQ